MGTSANKANEQELKELRELVKKLRDRVDYLEALNRSLKTELQVTSYWSNKWFSRGKEY